METSIISEIPRADDSTQRTIVDVIDVDSGESLDANELINKLDESQLAMMRETLSLARQSGNYKYVCAVCCQPIKLVGKKFSGKSSYSYYFSHLANSDECPVKTQNEEFDPQILVQQWLENFQIGEIHKILEKDTSTILSIDNGLDNLQVRPLLSDTTEDIHNKVDFSFNFKNRKIAVAFCLYNSFLNRLVYNNSFFKEASIYHLWIMPYFTKLNQKMSEKDVVYSHHRNVFVFDNIGYYREKNDVSSSKPEIPNVEGYTCAFEESLKQGRFLLNCFWQVPYLKDDCVLIEWKHKLVGLDDLRFDKNDYSIYYHDSDKDFIDIATPENRIFIDEWNLAKEERWDKIFKRIEDRKNDSEIRLKKEHEKEKRQHFKDILNSINNGERKIEKYIEMGKWGFKSGDVIIIPPKYKEVYDFEKGIAFVKQSRWGAIDILGKKQLNFQYNKVTKINSYYYIIEHSNHLRGIISSDLKIILPCKYKTLELYQGMVTMRYRPQGELYSKRYYLFGLGTDRNKSFPEDQLTLLDQKTNLWIVRNGLEMCVLRSDGIEVIPYGIYYRISLCCDSFIIVSRSKDLHNIFRLNGSYVTGLETEFDSIYIDEPNHHIIAVRSNKYGAFDLNGKMIFEYKYESLRYLREDLWIACQIDGEGNIYSQLVNLNTKSYSDKIYFEIIDTFDNYYLVKVFPRDNNSSQRISSPYTKGLANQNGDLIIHCMYDDFSFVSEFLIKVKDSTNRYHLYKLDGTDLCPDGVFSISDNIDNIIIINKKRKYEKNDCYGAVSHKGTVILKCSYKYNLIRRVDKGRFVAIQKQLFFNPDLLYNNKIFLIGTRFLGNCDGYRLKDEETIVCDNGIRGILKIDNILKFHMNKFDYISGAMIEVKVVGTEDTLKLPILEPVIKPIITNMNLDKGQIYQGYINCIYNHEIAIKVKGYGFVYCHETVFNQSKDFNINTISTHYGKKSKVDEDKELVSFIFKGNDVAVLCPIEKNYKYPGIVINKTTYGAFVRINHLKDGLLHVSMLKKVGLSLNDLKIGDIIMVEVDDISDDKQKYSLSIANSTFIVGETYNGIISHIANYGLFVSVPLYGRGLVHVTQLDAINKTISDFNVGDFVKVTIVGFKGKKISMSIA